MPSERVHSIFRVSEVCRIYILAALQIESVFWLSCLLCINFFVIWWWTRGVWTSAKFFLLTAISASFFPFSRKLQSAKNTFVSCYRYAWKFVGPEKKIYMYFCIRFIYKTMRIDLSEGKARVQTYSQSGIAFSIQGIFQFPDACLKETK